VGAGLLLDRAEAGGWILRAFAALFAASLVFRAASTAFLARHGEPVPIPPGFRRYTRGGLMRAGPSRRLLLHLLAFQGSVWIAAPFFTPYMLGPLGLDAGRYMVLLAVAFLARIAAYPILGRVLGRVGPGRMLLGAGLGIVPLAWLWTVSDAFPYLVALQVVAGFVWGAHELAVLILFFETIDHAHRTAVLTLYNVANAAAMAGGTAIGAVLLGRFGTDAAGYALVLGASSVARGFSMLWVPGIRTVVSDAVVPAIRTLAARPGVGSVDRPVLGSLDPSPVGAPGPDRAAERGGSDAGPGA
jgi:MFS family permease